MFGIKKEKRVSSKDTLTQQAAPVADVANSEIPVSASIPANSEPVYNPADDEIAANYCSGYGRKSGLSPH